MSEQKILLGFSVPNGEPVYLSLHHLAIFGMTALSGKTTALEALISRSGLRAIAFKTKRGEAGFTKYNLVTPYYKPRADWQFVEGLVNVALSEKVKYEPGMRYAIMKVCKGRKDLREIQKAAQDLAKETKREFMKSVYEKLVAYLEIVLPELEKWVFTDQLEIREGVNVMDLSNMRLETQHLVIASTIEYAFSYLDHVVVIVPEAWETLPQGKMTPVKWVAQQFIRKGAAIGNYLWLDSQDIGGIEKTPLRQCDNWLMGRMKEAHEVERILKQLLGLKVPKEEIQTLPLGHFYAAIGNEVKKVYVLPVSVPEEDARRVARGELEPEYIRDTYLKPLRVLEEQDLTYKPLWEEEKRKREELEKQFADMRTKIFNEFKEAFDKQVEAHRKIAFQEAMAKIEQIKKEWNVEELQQTIRQLKDENARLKEDLKTADQLKFQQSEEIERLERDVKAFQKFKEALLTLLPTPITTYIPTVDVPSEINVSMEQPALTIQKRTPPLTLNDSTLEGKIAIVYAEGKLPKDRWFTVTDVTKAFQSHGWKQDPRTSMALDKFCQWGYFEKQMSGRRPDYRIRVAPEDARSKGLLKEVEV